MNLFFDHLYKFAAVLVVSCVVCAWLLAPAPTLPQARSQNAAPDWSLPTHVAAATDSNSDAYRSLWGTVAQASADAPLNEPDWHFSGVTQAGNERFVMISVTGQAMQMLKVGDVLPGGAKILKIDEDHLSLLLNGKHRRLDLFQ